MNKEQNVQWQYRTLLFEFQKDGLLGDKYIDDEEAEALLNEHGARGWELVNVTMIQEGLLAFCKRKVTITTKVAPQEEVARPIAAPSPGPASATTLQQQERKHIQHLENQRRETISTLERDIIGEIKIS